MQKEHAVAPRPIVKEPHKVLRVKAAALPARDIGSRRIRDLISAMRDTLAATPDGVGLAAPQIGVSLRVFIVSEEAEEIDRAQKTGWERRRAHEASAERPYEKRPWRYYAFINPVLKNHSRRTIPDTEGCLSVPGVFGEVPRYEKLTVEAYDEEGRKITRNCSRFFARVVQHELDHLEGILFIDKARNLTEVPEKKEP
jgi:peptide deformylase